MPAGLRLQEEYGDDLQIVFVEVQRTPRDSMETFGWKRKWMGTNAMWTTERPFKVSGVKGIPHFALLSAEGEVLLSGYSNSKHGEIRKLVAQEVRKRGRAPEHLSPKLAKAWKTFQRGKLAAGIAEAQKVAAKRPELAAQATKLVTDFRARVAARIDRAQRRLAEDPLGVEDEVATLAKGLAGEPDLLAQLADLQETLAMPFMAIEREAAKLLAKAEDRLNSRGSDDRGARTSLERLAKKYAESYSAERALHLLAILPR